MIAVLFAPFGLLPYWQFLWLWTAGLVGTAIWLGGRPVRPILAVFAFPPVALELYHGNIHLLMAAAIALGFRYPAAWSFVLLTKVTPGVGLAWFLFRREWRPLAIALGVTAALAGISFVANPAAWQSWITDSLGATASGAALNQFSLPLPLWVRVPLALVVVAWGARTDRRWTVPVAATLALPVLWPSGLAILAAVITIRQDRPQLEAGIVLVASARDRFPQRRVALRREHRTQDEEEAQPESLERVARDGSGRQQRELAANRQHRRQGEQHPEHAE